MHFIFWGLLEIEVHSLSKQNLQCEMCNVKCEIGVVRYDPGYLKGSQNSEIHNALLW